MHFEDMSGSVMQHLSMNTAEMQSKRQKEQIWQVNMKTLLIISLTKVCLNIIEFIWIVLKALLLQSKQTLCTNGGVTWASFRLCCQILDDRCSIKILDNR